MYAHNDFEAMWPACWKSPCPYRLVNRQHAGLPGRNMFLESLAVQSFVN
jgi:hypothetical protein